MHLASFGGPPRNQQQFSHEVRVNPPVQNPGDAKISQLHSPIFSQEYVLSGEDGESFLAKQKRHRWGTRQRCCTERHL